MNTGIIGVYAILGFIIFSIVCFVVGILYDQHRMRKWEKSDFSK